MTYLNKEVRIKFYENELLRETARILSATDRCPVSASSGSMDREYWAWSTKDFANMDMQRGVLCLSYIYCASFEGNFYYKQESMLEWIKMAVSFWIKRQTQEGAFDHLYIHENSWMAAAFTLLDMVESYILLKPHFSDDFNGKWLTAMRKAGDFIIKYDEVHSFISNHRAGAAAALLGLSKISGNEKYKTSAWEIMNRVYQKQSQKEGWYLEYEGADPGYQTLDTHYQARFAKFSGNDEKVINSIKKSLVFLSHFIHPDGSIGGEYGSRNCPHFFPGGFEYFASAISLAESISAAGTYGLANGYSCGLADADPRNEIPMVTSYVYAHMEASGNKQLFSEIPELPYKREGDFIFEEAGIYIKSTAKYYIVFGASKGGVIKIFEKSKDGSLIYSSCGYAGIINNKNITTHLYTLNPDMHILNNGVQISAPFYCFHPDRTMSGLKLLLFRIFNHTLGRIRIVSDFVRKYIIIGIFIKQRKPVSMFLNRELIFENDGDITVSDSFNGSESKNTRKLAEYGFLSTVYMASARYFRKQDFNHCWIKDVKRDIRRKYSCIKTSLNV